MSEGMNELDAYKHLLEVAENIMQSVDIEREILNKYDTLKKGIKAKIKYHKDQKLSTEAQSTAIYKTMIQQVTTCLHEFQTQIEEPDNPTFVRALENFKMTTKNMISAVLNNQKKKQQFRVDLVHHNYIFNQLTGRLENLVLLLEVHGKMQEIIQQTARKEVHHKEKELQYQERIKKLSKQVQKIKNIQGYIKQCQTVKSNQHQLKILQKQLKLWVSQLI